MQIGGKLSTCGRQRGRWSRADVRMWMDGLPFIIWHTQIEFREWDLLRKHFSYLPVWGEFHLRIISTFYELNKYEDDGDVVVGGLTYFPEEITSTQILKDEPCHFPVGGHLQIPQRLQRRNYVAIQLLTFESIEECNIGHHHDEIIFSSTVTQQLPYPPLQLMPAWMSVKTMRLVLGHAEFIIIPLQSLAL